MSSAFQPEKATGQTGRPVAVPGIPTVAKSTVAPHNASTGVKAIHTGASSIHSYGNSTPAHITHETRVPVEGLPHISMNAAHSSIKVPH